MEDCIQQMLSNQISMRAFLGLLFSNPDLESRINYLVPEAAKNNPNHPIWLEFSYDAMKKVNFILMDEIRKWAVFDGSLGDNLNIFGIIRCFYCFSHPGFQPTKKYNEEYSFFLDVVGEKYGGPEVDQLINEIIIQYVSIMPKTRRTQEAKKRIALTFHVTGTKYPHWINGAEWPMGVSSPMQYIDSQKAKGGRIYRFQDVDTGDYREILQYY